MASDKILQLTPADGSGAFRISEKRILRVLSASTGTTVEYVEGQAETGLRKKITVDEVPSAIDTASTHIFPVSVDGQFAYYINNKYVISIDTFDSVAHVTYDMAGQAPIVIVTKRNRGYD